MDVGFPGHAGTQVGPGMNDLNNITEGQRAGEQVFRSEDHVTADNAAAMSRPPRSLRYLAPNPPACQLMSVRYRPSGGFDYL